MRSLKQVHLSSRQLYTRRQETASSITALVIIVVAPLLLPLLLPSRPLHCWILLPEPDWRVVLPVACSRAHPLCKQVPFLLGYRSSSSLGPCAVCQTFLSIAAATAFSRRCQGGFSSRCLLCLRLEAAGDVGVARWADVMQSLCSAAPWASRDVWVTGVRYRQSDPGPRRPARRSLPTHSASPAGPCWRSACSFCCARSCSLALRGGMAG